jgi:hypothetical protein
MRMTAGCQQDVCIMHGGGWTPRLQSLAPLAQPALLPRRLFVPILNTGATIHTMCTAVCD